MILVRVLYGFFAFCLVPAMPIRANADEAPAPASFFARLGLPEGRGEFTNGVDATGNAWSTYASAVIAVTGPQHLDGWRLKVSGLYSKYSYETRQTYCQLSAEEKKQLTGTNFSDLCNSIANAPPQGDERDEIQADLAPFGLQLEGDQIIAVTPHEVTRYHVGVAPGYQTTVGALILKAYLGVAFEQQTVMPPDISKTLQGSYWGAQGWLEAWLPLGEDFWLSADSSYFTGTSSYSAAMKIGYQPLSWLAIGPEFATYGDEDDVSGRAGIFLRFNAAGMETTLAGGVSGAYRDDPGAYGMASMYKKF